MRILVVDDEPDVVESVRLGFTLQWREVDVLGAGDAEAALDAVEQEHPDIVLLDVGLPGIDGFEVLRQIRAFSDVPVVMLTARDDAMDKVKGLELGADDYVTKPFNHLELMARVKAVLRRLEMPAPTSRAPSFQSGDLEVDFAKQEARLRGERLDLTPTEYKLLYHLVRNAGHVLSTERCWRRSGAASTSTRSTTSASTSAGFATSSTTRRTPRATSGPSEGSGIDSSRPADRVATARVAKFPSGGVLGDRIGRSRTSRGRDPRSKRGHV